MTASCPLHCRGANMDFSGSSGQSCYARNGPHTGTLECVAIFLVYKLSSIVFNRNKSPFSLLPALFNLSHSRASGSSDTSYSVQ